MRSTSGVLWMALLLRLRSPVLMLGLGCSNLALEPVMLSLPAVSVVRAIAGYGYIQYESPRGVEQSRHHRFTIDIDTAAGVGRFVPQTMAKDQLFSQLLHLAPARRFVTLQSVRLGEVSMLRAPRLAHQCARPPSRVLASRCKSRKCIIL